jgi:hypothetical protein
MPSHRTRPATCRIDDCTKPANVNGTARGYCTAHYWRIRRTGFAECFARDCHRAVGSAGEFGFCATHKELVA